MSIIDEERAARRRASQRLWYRRNRAKVAVSVKAYKAANRDKVNAAIYAIRDRWHALGLCITCHQPHHHISQKTRILAKRCHGCASKESRAQCGRYAAKKVAA